MKIKNSWVFWFFGAVMYCLIILFQFYHHFNIHTYTSRCGINEHVDFDFNLGGFNIVHDIKKDSGELILSEVIEGVYLRDVFSGAYYLYPTSYNDAYSDSKRSGSLTKIGTISLCQYNIGEQRIVFIEKERGYIEVSGNNVHLSSIFSGKDRKHAI